MFIIWGSRTNSRILRWFGFDSHQTVHSLRFFRKALDVSQLTPQVVRSHGCLFSLRNTDLINLKIALVGAHEYDVTSFLLRHAYVSDVFVDVGANIGYYTVILGKRLTSGRVVSIEPYQSSVAQLRENIRLNKLTNVTVVPSAAWAQSNVKLPLYSPDEHNLGANTLLKLGTQISVSTTVTLDELLKHLEVNAVDIVKIDVEGAEKEVILGMTASLARFRPRFVLCALDHPESQQRSLTCGLIQEIGYEEIDWRTDVPLSQVDGGARMAFFRSVPSSVLSQSTP